MNIDALQKIIHRLEVGGGLRYLRVALMVLALLALVVFYDLWGCKNMGTQEGMDAAQLGRNLVQGKGWTTLFIRPLSLHLVSQQNEKLKRNPQHGNLPDPSQIRGAHPDISNPPAYPALLFLVMKGSALIGLPWTYSIPAKPGGFWSINGVAMRYPPDFWIAILNQLLFLATVGLTFLLARRLFNKGVAWLAVLLLLGSELQWRFTSSGLSTTLLMLIFTGLAWCLLSLEEEIREPRWGLKGIPLLSAFAGLLVGVGALTRYSFGLLIIPVVGFIILFAGRQRWLPSIAAFLVFAAALTPWVIRNYDLSGVPFGTATYKVIETSAQFPEHHLERSLTPDFSRVDLLRTIKDKLLTNSRHVLQDDLPKLCGSWASAFFLAGLFVVYQHPGVRRLRFFLLGCLLVLALIQTLARTQLSEDSPEINSENLLILLVPMVVVYGASLFLLLLEQVNWPYRELRYAAIGAFALVTSLPLILALSRGFLRHSPLAYPPYFPTAIQAAASYLKEDEMAMSDIPWAMAWYGQKQCVWLTLNSQTDFFEINDYRKSVQELYLTQVTLDSRFLTQWVRGGELNWGSFVLGCILRKEMKQSGPPTGFPLPHWQMRALNAAGAAVAGYPEMFLLTARDQPVPETLPTGGAASPLSNRLEP
jgi:hypothetical protein